MKGTKSGGSKETPQSKKKTVAPPTLSEWEKALKEAVELDSSGEGKTVGELAERTGFHRERVCRFLKKMICEGRAKCTPRGKQVISISGRCVRVPSYVLVKNGVKK